MSDANRPIAAIVLAAGKGTRMKSDIHKVLHPVAGRPMIEHLLASLAQLAPERTVVIVGDLRDQLKQALGGRVEMAVQDPQLGTGHAVQQAEGALGGFRGDILILYGDVPFVQPETMRAMAARLNEPDAPAVVVLGFEPADPLQYGRVIAKDGAIAKMVEFKDASEAERAVGLCNSGLMAVRGEELFGLLHRVKNDNAQREYYLPDIVNLALADSRPCAVVVAQDADEVAGINSRAELAEAEARWQRRRRGQAMADGATLTAPDTVFFSWDTQLGRDVLVEPNVIFEPRVQVGDRSTLEANLIIPAGSVIPPDTVVTRENLFTFDRSAIRSSDWTGRYSTSDRLREVVRVGPGVIAGISDLIGQLEWRGHNSPPGLLDMNDDEVEEALGNLKVLRMRLNELIVAIEQGRADKSAVEEVAAFYRGKLAPWFKERMVESGRSANGVISLSFVFVPLFAGLSWLFDEEAYIAFTSAAVGGLLGGSLLNRRD